MLLASQLVARMAAPKRDWILVTGQPGCGKTTEVKKMVSLLQINGLRCKGFYTEEVLDDSGCRIGFDVVTVPDGRRGILARKEGIVKTKYKTGKYFVDVDSFESLALPSLSFKDEDGEDEQEQQSSSQSSIVYVLDEIGRMELHSSLFSDHVRSMLDQNIRLVGAITAPRYGHRVPFCDEVSSVEGVHVYKLTKKTRVAVVDSLQKTMKTTWLQEARGF